MLAIWILDLMYAGHIPYLSVDISGERMDSLNMTYTRSMNARKNVYAKIERSGSLQAPILGFP